MSILSKNKLDQILKKSIFCRAIEESIYDKVEKKQIKIPVYLSAGQELISSTISYILEELEVLDRQIFIQHRGHSTYVNFGGDIDTLFKELLGIQGYGKKGSASIDSIKNNIIGHDGMMGSHIPIATGMCYSNKKPTIVFTGDAAAEEDYSLASYGWAATKNLPILFIVEDNDLSILTEKKIRRSWELAKLANAFGLEAYNISDDPEEIYSLRNRFFKKPMLLNINTKRKFWHAGAGIDNKNQFDRLEKFINKNDKLLEEYYKQKGNIEEIWNKLLETL